MQVHFLTYPSDGGPAEELGPWEMRVPPERGDLVTLQLHDGSASAWVVQQISHHVGLDFHQLDVVVSLAAEDGLMVPERAG